jgi:hypothetical protein
MEAGENDVPCAVETWNKRRHSPSNSRKLKKLVEEQSVLVEWSADKSLVCRNEIAEPPVI